MPDPFPEIMSVPVLSTAHLTRLDHDLLEAAIDMERFKEREGDNVTFDWDHPLILLNDRNYGYWVYCGHEGLQADEEGVAYVCDELEKAGFSHSFIEILIAGKEAGHTYIRFDCDGLECEKLPTFEWSVIREENVAKLEKQLRVIHEKAREGGLYARTPGKSTNLLDPMNPLAQYQALVNGLILGLIPKLDANADEVLQAAGRVGMPWTYKDIPRLFVLASKADLVGDGEFYVFNPDTGRVEGKDTEPEPWFRNHYKCYKCGHEWSDEWSAHVDDDCPECGARHVTPHESESIEKPE